MHVKIDIGFEQLVSIVKRLPAKQWAKLKEEVEMKKSINNEREDFRKLLLRGPQFSENQLNEIIANRKKIDEWRTE